MRKINVLLVAAGLAGFATLAAKIGWVDVLHQLLVARTVVPILIALGILRLVLQTAAWSAALRAHGVHSRFMNLAWVRLSAQSVGYFSVLGPAVAEPMKIRLLRGNQGPGTVPTLADAGIYGFTSCLFGIAGCICAGLVMVHRQHVASLMGLAAGLVLGTALLMCSKPLLKHLVDYLEPNAPGWLHAGARIEREIRRFCVQHRGPVQRMFWLGLGCQMLLACDIVAVSWSLGIPFHAATILALEAASRAARVMAGWMPARIGIDEAGAVAAFVSFGLAPASGLTLALSRRMRDLLLCLLGVGWLLWKTGSPAKCASEACPRPAPETSTR